MALRQIVTEPDEMLQKISRDVGRIDDRLQMLIDDMLQTMKENNGIGLAAVQVGVLRRLFVIDLNDDHGPYVLVNPVILEKSGVQTGQEGCLSVPGSWGDVERPAHVVMQAMDRNGKPYTLEAEGLLAVCACHENDHLDGILFKDKVIGELIRT